MSFPYEAKTSYILLNENKSINKEKRRSTKLEIKTKQRNENSKSPSEETLVEIGNKITGTPTTKTYKTNPRR